MNRLIPIKDIIEISLDKIIGLGRISENLILITFLQPKVENAIPIHLLYYPILAHPQ